MNAKSPDSDSSQKDSTNAGYDEAVHTLDDRGIETVDTDELIELQRESTVDSVPTLTPSPTARDDEDPTAFDETNIAGINPLVD